MRRFLPGARLFRLVAVLAAAASWPQAAPVCAQGRVARVPGIVRNEQGEPVTGATVVAENRRAAPHLFATTTDGNGAFVLVGLDAGAWIFTIGSRGYAPLQVTVLLASGVDAPAVELVLKKGVWAPPPPVQGGRLAGVDLFRLQTALQNADTLMRAKQYDQAIAAYRDVLAKAPALTRTNLAIGDAWRMKGNSDRAIGAYREVLASEPENEMAVLGIAAAEVERGALGEAETVLAQAAGGPKPGRDTLCALGDVKLAQRQPDEAAGWYRKAAAADPAWARPVLKLGLLAAARQDAEAGALLQKAIRLAPGSAEAAEAARALDALRK